MQIYKGFYYIYEDKWKPASIRLDVIYDPSDSNLFRAIENELFNQYLSRRQFPFKDLLNISDALKTSRCDKRNSISEIHKWFERFDDIRNNETDITRDDIEKVENINL